MDDIKLYSPCNGTEMDWFSSVFCFKCSKMPKSCEAKSQCGIMGHVFLYDVDEKGYPNQWRYVDGKPCCTAFVDREEANKKRSKKVRVRPNTDKKTMDLF